MTWSTIPLKCSNLFKIVESVISFYLNFFFNSVNLNRNWLLTTDSAILNKFEPFNEMVNKWRSPPENCQILPIKYIYIYIYIVCNLGYSRRFWLVLIVRFSIWPKRGGFLWLNQVDVFDCLPCTCFNFGLVCHNCIPRYILNFDSLLSFWQKSF